MIPDKQLRKRQPGFAAVRFGNQRGDDAVVRFLRHGLFALHHGLSVFRGVLVFHLGIAVGQHHRDKQQFFDIRPVGRRSDDGRLIGEEMLVVRRDDLQGIIDDIPAIQNLYRLVADASQHVPYVLRG